MYGNIIKEERKKRGLRQSDLARLIGFKSASAIGMIEREEREVSLETLKKISLTLDVSIDYLLGQDNIKIQSTKDPLSKAPDNDNDNTYNQITDVKEAMELILNQPGLMLNGELLDDKTKLAIANAINMGFAWAEQERKKEIEQK